MIDNNEKYETEDVLAERPPCPVRPPLIDLRDTTRPLREFKIILLSVAGKLIWSFQMKTSPVSQRLSDNS